MKFAAFVTALLPWWQSPFGYTRDHVLLPSQSFALNIAAGNRKQPFFKMMSKMTEYPVAAREEMVECERQDALGDT